MDNGTNPQPQDKKTARRNFNEFIRFANQAATEMEKAMKSLDRQQELKRRNKLIKDLVQIMRSRGASDRSIQKALPGIVELAKYGPNPASSNTGESQAAFEPVEEALGMLLSEVETREVHWLWEKRIPLGKITLLDGDPGMGKSLLALQIAASVTTGQPMPDGTPGARGSVIMIAPEDGAGDTLRPRLEAAGGDPSQVLLLNIVEGLDARKIRVNDRPFSLSKDLEILE
jgi:hypothetical protein